MIALAFTLLLPFNILGMRVFFKKPIPPTMYVGASLGMTGIILIFYERLVDFQTEGEIFKGLGLALLSTICASAGNMLAYRNHLRKIPVTAANSWGMFYGTLTTLIIAFVLQKPLHFTDSFVYWSSLAYLSLFGTVLAFGAYLTLVARIGAEGAGYTTILAPVVAVSLSMLFENLTISASIGWGLFFCLIGNYVTLHGQRKVEAKLV
jgi:drug/metabolite transporter (DMT)-like permease